MQRSFKVAVLFTSPGFGGDGGGIMITPNGIHRIPPWTPKVRETMERAIALFEASRDPDGVPPGSMPHPHVSVVKLSEQILIGMAENLAGNLPLLETGTSGGIILMRDYRTGNYIYIDEHGHIHHGVVDPRVVELGSAVEIFLQAGRIHDAAVAHRIQEMITPIIKEKAAEFSELLLPV